MKKRVAVVIFIIIAILSIACTKKETKEPWKRENIGKVTFEVNPAWEKKENDLLGYYYYPSSGMIMTQRILLSTPTDIYEDFDAFISGYGKSVENWSLIKKEKQKIGSYSALRLNATCKLNGSNVNCEMMLVYVNKEMIVIGAFMPVDEYMDYKKDINRIFDSINVDETIDNTALNISEIEKEAKKALENIIDVKSVKAEVIEKETLKPYKLTITMVSEPMISVDVKGALVIPDYITTITKNTINVYDLVGEYDFIFQNSNGQTEVIATWSGGGNEEDVIFKDSNGKEISRITLEERDAQLGMLGIQKEIIADKYLISDAAKKQLDKIFEARVKYEIKVFNESIDDSRKKGEVPFKVERYNKAYLFDKVNEYAVRNSIETMMLALGSDNLEKGLREAAKTILDSNYDSACAQMEQGKLQTRYALSTDRKYPIFSWFNGGEHVQFNLLLDRLGMQRITNSNLNVDVKI